MLRPIFLYCAVLWDYTKQSDLISIHAIETSIIYLLLLSMFLIHFTLRVIYQKC